MHLCNELKLENTEEERSTIKVLLHEIKEEIAALRQSSDKNHQDLKIEFLTFKTNIQTGKTRS